MPYTTDEPTISQYKNSIKKVQQQYNKCDLTYFPKEIPQNATNYYFYIGTAFDGYNIYYLKFNTDEAYTKNLIEKYKDDILKTGTKNTLYTEGLDIGINELNDNFKIYLLKQRSIDSCENCKYGFAINPKDENKTVYFFFQNY